MRKYLVISLVCNVLLFSAFGFKVYKKFTDKPRKLITENAYWLDKVTQYEVLNSKFKGGILFVGDSIIDRFSIEEFFYPIQIFNRGNAWEDTRSLLTRLETTVISKRPTKVLVCIGTNDIGYNFPFSETLKNMETIIDRLINAEIKIAVLSILPVWEENKRDNEDIVRLNSAYKELCINKKVTFIDIYDAFINKKSCLKRQFSTDGVHLNGKGYEVFADLLEKEPFLK